MKRVRIGSRNGPAVIIDHWPVDEDVSIEVEGVEGVEGVACVYLKPKQIDAVIRALAKACAEIEMNKADIFEARHSKGGQNPPNKSKKRPPKPKGSGV